MLHPTRVALERDSSARYPEAAPYHPGKPYPEIARRSPFGPRNDAFDLVRQALISLDLDREHIATTNWNPLGELVRPGDVVVLKPNMIRQSHLFRDDDWDYVITHGSVIRAAAEYVALALEGRGRIKILDGPQTDSNYDLIKERMGLEPVAAHIRAAYGVDVELVDLRRERWAEHDGIYTARIPLTGDPLGYTRADLGSRSRFAGVEDGRFYGAYYDIEETNRHHSAGRHEYMFSASVCAADVFINLPKLKSHKKCGITLNLKNLVGCNGDKNWLPHYTLGTPEQGGDQFAQHRAKYQLERSLVAFAKRLMIANGGWRWLARMLKKPAYRVFGETTKIVRSGNWYGNETIWRMILDLNAIMLYADREGTLHPERRRRFFSIVDGIRAGEGNGPVEPDPVDAGIVLAGADAAAVDCVAATAVGFDYRKIQHLREAFAPASLPIASVRPDDVEVVSSDPEIARPRFLLDPPELYRFKPHFGWKGHIELDIPVAVVGT